MSMKRALSVVLALAIVLAYQPLPLAAGQNTGEISGTAMSAGKPLANTTVRLRNVDNGQLVGTQRTNEKGEYRFTGLAAGTYVVEIVSDRGALMGTSARVSLTSAAMAQKGVTVTASAAAAAGGGAAATGMTAGAGGFFGSTAGIITIAAIAAGITIAAIAAQDDGSPSR